MGKMSMSESLLSKPVNIKVNQIDNENVFKAVWLSILEMNLHPRNHKCKMLAIKLQSIVQEMQT